MDHRGSLSQKKNLEFKVHWKGYAPNEDSWVPYSELRDSGALHHYLLAKQERKFHQLVPRKYFREGRYDPDED